MSGMQWCVELICVDFCSFLISLLWHAWVVLLLLVMFLFLSHRWCVCVDMGRPVWVFESSSYRCALGAADSAFIFGDLLILSRQAGGTIISSLIQLCVGLIWDLNHLWFMFRLFDFWSFFIVSMLAGVGRSLVFIQLVVCSSSLLWDPFHFFHFLSCHLCMQELVARVSDFIFFWRNESFSDRCALGASDSAVSRSRQCFSVQVSCFSFQLHADCLALFSSSSISRACLSFFFFVFDSDGVIHLCCVCCCVHAKWCRSLASIHSSYVVFDMVVFYSFFLRVYFDPYCHTQTDIYYASDFVFLRWEYGRPPKQSSGAVTRCLPSTQHRGLSQAASSR